MLWMYIAMLETAEQKEKITYIYENYADLMYCEALKVVGEHYLAEDVVHETFLHLIRILDDVEVADTKKLKRFPDDYHPQQRGGYCAETEQDEAGAR